ncbi:MAG: PQQ-binding-like beta-propeller repeat protein [candidate division KSB1 bacterium]|nr:PQQ-binding-like beta-propeller repeat protein [candidate division KSB1 bacterium]MDZ7319582.1 PQQ-binding-like beta-propeller repeat protein [candidate division KSB1 bacterium]MDZ7339942.1 PQQ-binding-like beta-propeller repeat protein [candidate division KSB1 bacterium]
MKYRYIIILFLGFFYCYAVAAFCQQEAICFAWLSDTHVGSPTGAADLRAAVRDINDIEDIDFVILSGDITEMGSNNELELAKAILDSLNKPYHIIPGNHDTKWSESGCSKFGELWGNDKFNFQFERYRFIGMHQGPLLRMGDGHFAPEDLHWLDSALVNLSDPEQPLIFVTHYPIDTSVDNWFEFLDRVRKYQTKAILFGHGHRNKSYDLEGIPGVMGRSTLRRDQPVGGYNIVTIENDSMFFYERLPLPPIHSDRAERINHSISHAPGPMPNLWHKLSLERCSVDSNTAKFNRPDFSVNQRFPEVKIKWSFDCQATTAGSPRVWRDWVVMGDRHGRCYGLSLKDGKKRWTFQAKGSIFSGADVADGRLVFAATDKNIYCLSIENGQLLWQYSTQAPVVAAPRIQRGTVYIGASDGRFRALDLHDGKLKWEFSGVAGFVETRPLVYQDQVIFGAWDTFLYALNKKDGSLVWKWSNGHPGRLFSPAACWPVAADNKVFIVAPDRYITAIDSKTGAIVWRTNAYKVRESIGISEDGRRIYARCMEDTLLAFSAEAASPQLVWAASCNYGYDIAASMPVEKDGVVFFGTKNGFLYAVDAKTGRVNFEFRVGTALIHTVAPLDENRVVLSDMDGRVMLIEQRR